MSNAKTMLIYAASVSIFIAALMIGLQLTFGVSKAINTVYDLHQVQDPNLVTTLSISDHYTVSGAVVLQSIFHMNDIGTDIVVNGVTYPFGVDIDELNVTSIQVDHQYQVTYHRDFSGNLVLVEYHY